MARGTGLMAGSPGVNASKAARAAAVAQAPVVHPRRKGECCEASDISLL